MDNEGALFIYINFNQPKKPRSPQQYVTNFQRSTAFLMGRHFRLGRNSYVRLLPKDVLVQILDYLKDYKIFVLGGREMSSNSRSLFKTLSTTEVFSLEHNNWSHRILLDVPRCKFQALYYEEKVYILGGQFDRLKKSSVYRYSFKEREWVTLSNMREQRTKFGSVILENKIWVFGGSSTCEVYDISSNKWEFIAPLPFDSFSTNAVRYSDKEIAVLSIPKKKWVSHSIIYLYNIDTNSYSVLTNEAPPVGDAGFVNHKGELFVFGGRIPWNMSMTYSCSKFLNGKWIELSKIPFNFGTAGMTCQVINDKIYIIGGVQRSDGNESSQGLVFIYDTINDSFSIGTPMLSRRQYPSSFVIRSL